MRRDGIIASNGVHEARAAVLAKGRAEAMAALEKANAQIAAHPETMAVAKKPRRDLRAVDNMCEPCGGCRWCKTNFRARREAKRAKVELARALKLLEKAAWALVEERSAGSDHPVHVAAGDLGDRISKFVRRVRG